MKCPRNLIKKDEHMKAHKKEKNEKYIYEMITMSQNKKLERDHYLAKHWVFSLPIFLSTPRVGAEFWVDGGMFWCIPSVGIAFVCGCTCSWSWGHDNFLNKGQKDLTKLNAGISSIILEVLSSIHRYGFGRNLHIIEEHAIWILIL